jgi:hypothetical protein
MSWPEWRGWREHEGSNRIEFLNVWIQAMPGQLREARASLQCARDTGSSRTIMRRRRRLSSLRCEWARLVCERKAQADHPAAWRRWVWIHLVEAYRRELANTLAEVAYEEGVLARRAATASVARRRHDEARVAAARGALKALLSRAPQPYHQWRREREAWLQQQLAGLSG